MRCFVVETYDGEIVETFSGDPVHVAAGAIEAYPGGIYIETADGDHVATFFIQGCSETTLDDIVCVSLAALDIEATGSVSLDDITTAATGSVEGAEETPVDVISGGVVFRFTPPAAFQRRREERGSRPITAIASARLDNIRSRGRGRLAIAATARSIVAIEGAARVKAGPDPVAQWNAIVLMAA